MFFLIPLGHEQTSLRRAPWVTIAIAFICLLVQVRACSIEPQVLAEAERITEQIDATELRILQQGSSAGSMLRQAGYEGLANEVDGGHPVAISQAVAKDVAQLQAQLSVLKAQRDAVLERMPSMELGYQPARDGVVAMITSAFAHDGWIHLIGNLLFLYVVGCNMEDRWGRGIFAAFYLVSAVVSALAFKLAQPSGLVPLIGASGAVAAAMGAFMVFYGRATIRFLYAYWIFLRPRWGTFYAPAWSALLMWFAQQVLMAFLDDGSAGGVAYSAHVGGFTFGLIVAFVLKATDLDKKFDTASEATVVEVAAEWTESPQGEALLLALDQRQPDQIRQHVGEAFVGWSRSGSAERVTSTYRRIREQHWELELGETALRAVVSAAAHKGTDPLVCVDVASQLIRQHPESQLIPRAMWIAAEAHESLNRSDLALRTLHNLVVAFPMEPLTQQARRKLGMASLRPPAM